jgi:anti-sigma-K factor RskA
MIGKKRNRALDERLDLIGRDVVRASAANETEAEAAATSPFLYARLRSRINAEREQREDGERWYTMLGIAWRAVPAMAMVAILAVTLFLFSSFGTTQSPGVFTDEAMADAGYADVENVVFADNRSMTNDEVLATILSEDEQEASR